MDKILKQAQEWAVTNGLYKPFRVSKPQKQEFGWTLTVSETDGKHRTANLRFDRKGRPAMWEMVLP